VVHNICPSKASAIQVCLTFESTIFIAQHLSLFNYKGEV